MRTTLLIFFICLAFLPFHSLAQDGESSRLDKALAFPDKVFGQFEKKAALAQERLDKQTDRYLSRLQRREEKLRRKLYRKDSLAAKALFPDVAGQYQKLKSLPGNVSPLASVYSGHLDSLATSLRFLEKAGQTSAQAQKALGQLGQLQKGFNASEQVKQQLTLREQQLKEGLQKFGLVKELKRYQKQAYYYKAQVEACKKLFSDPAKLEEKVLETLARLPQFRSFFSQHSQLASLFSLPGGPASTATASLAGLQTRAMVNQLITQRFGSSAAITDQLRSNVQAAQAQLGQLRSRMDALRSGSRGNTAEGDLPSFKPNGQHTKSFGQRLEWGANMQSQPARYYFPVSSDIGVQVGYKINDNSSAGVGLSYKMGWGRNWNDIHLTHQGVGLRSYVEWKLKGAFFIAGGYELNYRAAFKTIEQLKDYAAWQKSGLIGISKKYSVSKKMKGDMKLLWDFLSYSRMPRTQAILFRVGYSLK